MYLDVFRTVLFVFVASVIGFTWIVYDDATNVASSKYFDGCLTLIDISKNLDIKDCISYATKNPDATGQDVLDYYNIEQNYDILTKSILIDA